MPQARLFTPLIGAGILCAVLLVAPRSEALAQGSAPTWSYGQLRLQIGQAECMARAALAFKQQKMETASRTENIMLGKKDIHLGTITCAALSDSAVLVNIVVASNGGSGPVSGGVRVELQDEMEKSSCRMTPWGFRYCYGGSSPEPAAEKKAPPQRKAPGWMINRKGLPIDSEECLGRAALAYKATGLAVEWDGEQGVFVGEKDIYLAIIGCQPQGAETNVSIIIAANGGRRAPADALREALWTEMGKSRCRPTPWGFQYCYGRQLTKK